MGCMRKGESERWKWHDRGFLSGEEAIECGRWGVYRHWQIKIQFGLEQVTEWRSQERQQRMGRENPVSLTITAIILMWPTFLTAYHFHIKTESLYQAHTPSVCISRRREFSCVHVYCVLIAKSCVCVLRLCYVILYLKRNLYCHHQLGSVAPGGAETANIPPTLAPIYPIITLLSKHNVSSGCLASVCLNIEMREAKNDGAPRRNTETKENTCLCELRGRKMWSSLCSSGLHAHINTHCAHTQSLWHWWS